MRKKGHLLSEDMINYLGTYKTNKHVFVTLFSETNLNS